MAASTTSIEDFLKGPLVTWLSTCVKKPDALQMYETFIDGAPIIEVLLQIDPQPAQPIPSPSNLPGLSITTARIKTFYCIINSIKKIYEEELGQVLISLPDCITLGKCPGSESALQQLKLLLLLLLGCAVQGPTKEYFITKIKNLHVDMQHDIVKCIKQVTDDQSIVLTLDWTEQPPQRLYNHVQQLVGERDKILQQWTNELSQENTGTSSAVEMVESSHLAVEVADWKAKLRRQRQELEEKSEILAECREELEHANNMVAKLKSENADLLSEVRRSKVYRDEMDAMREQAERADRLEAETQRYREKLADAEFYRIRVDELREDNKVLLETREMLESQLARARQRADHVLELEAELLTSKQKLNDVLLERDSAKERIQELIEETTQLQQMTKSILQENHAPNFTLDSDHEEINSGDNSLSEQLTNNAQTRVLRLELENQKLISTIDSLKEQSFHESANKLIELEKDKKKLTLKMEQLQQNFDRIQQQNGELEELLKDAIAENKKLLSNIDTIKSNSDKQLHDLQSERGRIAELEETCDNLTNEKGKLQAQLVKIEKRAVDAEKSLADTVSQLEQVKTQTDEAKLTSENEWKNKLVAVEKENVQCQKEVARLKKIIEEKEVALDEESEKNRQREKKIQTLMRENEKISTQLEQLQECEQKSQELISQASIYLETVTTLQKDLVSEKLLNEKFKQNLDKLGLTPNIFENNVTVIVEQLLKSPEVFKSCFNFISKNELNKSFEQQHDLVKDVPLIEVSSLQVVNDGLQAENAKLQVDISTLKSQVHSLQTQQTALQLANSQLVAEKEELFNQQQLRTTQYDALMSDQNTLRKLHEQLSVEYEQLKTEEESLKKLNRDLRSEVRSLKEISSSFKNKITAVESENESLKNGAKTLGILRAEHSKLKDDFRNLFTASERLKIEYRDAQEELKNLRAESRTLRLGQTEMQGELNSRSDLVAGLHLENVKLQQKCDMLFEMNHSLDSDRRALMDHVSQLLSQYHSLLTHSLEDKQHYHTEEKLFSDRMNNLSRQKERLEEKIMEHYRKLDNASAKKKSFGATLVRKVRKAGSDFINKVPNRNRRSWHEDASNIAHFQLDGGSAESGGNDSDNSVEDCVRRSDRVKRPGSLQGHRPKDEVALRRSYRNIAANRSSMSDDQAGQDHEGSLSLGAVGSRRTVYLSEDEPAATGSNSVKSGATPTVVNAAVNAAPPLLVYNKISTVIGGDAVKAAPQTKTSEDGSCPTRKSNSENSKETAVWYEYGCV